ncbi:MAG: ArsI/CadI family heavy metal resistance metalloenzyme [Thiomonas sp.]|uniref:ArsI/CadI family heavy metal resistance metalloenzyme n=1 Tax=Thiomonas sp. TaxID=2047785 RepID=UPI002A36B851|nr:ArsI/CadI family heavy metal resistance metalloenzyme [Thiomonas sp.]MDY0329728.1 ArsI/CadI family heavy metal resistance metalloenzyme [Thiomonas sp.]
MKRFHVHVSVPALDEAIRFYSGLFAAEPTVRKPDYAKWMLDDPRVNFAISQRGAEPGLNHLGIQVENEAELREMQQRLESTEADFIEEAGTACCYARSDKYWANDPVGIAWETYHTLDTIPMFNESPEAGGCCVPAAVVAAPAPQSPTVFSQPATCCGGTTSKSSCC